MALLNGYTLAIEQAAVYLGTSGVQPTELLGLLRAQGSAVLDEVGSSPAGTQVILHEEKLAATIVDQTLQRLPVRARRALAFAALLPPDTIPWSWLQELTETSTDESAPRLSGLAGGDDWAASRRLLEGRRLLTLADEPRFARLHRVLGEHIRQRPSDADTVGLLDTHLRRISEDLQQTVRAERDRRNRHALVPGAAGRGECALGGIGVGRQVFLPRRTATRSGPAAGCPAADHRTHRRDGLRSSCRRCWTVVVESTSFARGEHRSNLSGSN